MTVVTILQSNSLQCINNIKEKHKPFFPGSDAVTQEGRSQPRSLSQAQDAVHSSFQPRGGRGAGGSVRMFAGDGHSREPAYCRAASGAALPDFLRPQNPTRATGLEPCSHPQHALPLQSVRQKCDWLTVSSFLQFCA